MSAKESEPVDAPAEEADAADERAFAEGNHETVMKYGHGGVPMYVIAPWVCLIIGYVAYFYRYGWPDLAAWGIP